jgi:hypothetical protein
VKLARARSPAEGLRALAVVGALVAMGAAACGGSAAPQGAPPSPPASVAAALPPPDAGAGAPSQPQSREDRLIARMLKRVSKVRGIDAPAPVPGVVLSRDALIAKVKEHVGREIPPEAIRDEGLVLQLLGFVPTTFDYEAAEYSLLESQLAGYYEPSDKTMYMASDLEEDDASATLAHELVHALQDAKWDLKTRSRYRPGEGDLSTAVSALAEGDATSAMFDVVLEMKHADKTALDIPEDVFLAGITEGMNTGPTASSPHVMRASLAAPYVFGTRFVNALRRRGGWPAVDKAWDNPPTTSEQIMHLAKYDAHEPALTVTAPTASTLGLDFAVADTDVYGELGARLAFEEWMDEDAAAATAESWGGDEGVLFRAGNRAAFALRLRYDGDPKARESLARTAFDRIARALARRLGKPKVQDATPLVCYERAERGPLAIRRLDGDLVILAGPTKTGPAWTSTGDCTLARKWSDEISGVP